VNKKKTNRKIIRSDSEKLNRFACEKEWKTGTAGAGYRLACSLTSAKSALSLQRRKRWEFTPAYCDGRHAWHACGRLI
jgi:hypothetical protein